MGSFRSSRLVLATILLTAPLGCAHLYDGGKAASTARILEQYETADVAGLIATEQANLDALLAEEIATVRENQKIQNDFAILSIADNDTPMAETLTEEALQRIKHLGFDDRTKLLEALEGAIDSKAHAEGLEGQKSAIKDFDSDLPVPECQPGVPLPEAIGIKSENAELIADEYTSYKEICGNLLSAQRAEAGSGELGDAHKDWADAKSALAIRMQEVSRAQKEVKDARIAYRSALGAAQKAKKEGKDLEKEIEGAKLKLGTALDTAEKLGLGGGERVESILTLLAATAGGNANGNEEPGVRAAAIVAERIPSLAGDIATLRAGKRLPTVSNLLIEMQHQTVLLDYQKKLQEMDQREIALLEVKHRALEEEARQWHKFFDAMCSFAVLSNAPAGAHPGDKCLGFEAEIDAQTGGVRCTLGGRAIPNCVLGKPWHVALGKTAGPRPKRELYKALTAYLQALSQQSIPAEQNFRRIDLLHRRSLAASESSIRSWDNVVAVPIGQIDAYYQSGLRPEEIADLIVRALGFTAIGVGLAL